MCVVSMVHDWFEPRIPDFFTIPGTSTPIGPTPSAPSTPWGIPVPTPAQPHTAPVGLEALEPEQLEELAKLIRQFRAAVSAAKVVDRLTDQPDCIAPEKAKLEDRVAALEKEIARLKAAR